MTHLPPRDTTFTLAALAAEVARLSPALGAGAADERVSAVPDERTLRYYQSLGVLDRPTRYDGRQAVYGYRHLLQALAVKALQAQGLSLAQVQRSLAGATDALLESAVVEAMGVGSVVAAPPAPTVVTPASPRALVAFELAPGVVLSVDPALHADPAALAAMVAAALSPALPRGTRP